MFRRGCGSCYSIRDPFSVSTSVGFTFLLETKSMPRFGKWILPALCCVAIGAGLYGGKLLFDTVAPEIERARSMVESASIKVDNPSTLIYNDEGSVFAELSGPRKYPIKLNKLGRSTINAFLAAEDSTFLSHNGVSIRGMLRATFVNLRAGRIVEGASTISQQVARSLFLSRERTMTRKLREILLALKLERKFSKSEILTLYLNNIYLGNGAYGIEAASKTYFRKNASKLHLHEAALLAALPKAPSRMDPSRGHYHAKRAVERQKYILKRMFEEKMISASAYQKALGRKLRFYKERPVRIKEAPYFVDSLRSRLGKYLDEESGYRGLRISSTLNSAMQARLEKSLEQMLGAAVSSVARTPQQREKILQEVNTAGVIVHAPTGQVKAVVGGTSFSNSQFNRALSTFRPANHTFIPFHVLVGLSNGQTLYESLDRSGASLYDVLKRGDLYGAASNTAKYGIGSLKNLLSGFGVDTDRSDAGLLLGQEKVNLYQLARLYAVIALEGKMPPKFHLFDNVRDFHGGSILSFSDTTLEKYTKVKSRDARLLKEALRSGDCYSQYISLPSSGDDLRAVQFNHDYVAVQWIGTERGRVRFGKLSKDAAIAFAKSSSVLGGDGCKDYRMKNISYVPKKYRSESGLKTRWIPTSVDRIGSNARKPKM